MSFIVRFTTVADPHFWERKHFKNKADREAWIDRQTNLSEVHTEDRERSKPDKRQGPTAGLLSKNED